MALIKTDTAATPMLIHFELQGKNGAMMLINVYWNKATGDALIPSEAKTEAGFWLDIEPVERASIRDISSMRQALSLVLARSGKVFPTPPAILSP